MFDIHIPLFCQHVLACFYSLVRIRFNFCLFFMRCCAVWLKIVQACQINLVLSCGVCFLMEKLVEIWHFYEYFLKKCYYKNLFTLNL